MATGKTLLSSSAAWSRCRWIGPLSSVVPPDVRSLLEDDAAFLLVQRDCTERFESRLAFDARLLGSRRLYGRFFGDLYVKGLITVGTTRARVASFVDPEKRLSPALDFRHP